jgi:hypothetical protein
MAPLPVASASVNDHLGIVCSPVHPLASGEHITPRQDARRSARSAGWPRQRQRVIRLAPTKSSWAFGKRWIDGFSCHTPQSLVMRPDDNTCILNALPTQRDISPLHAPRKWAPASLHRDASQHTTRRTCHPSRSRHGCSRESAVSPVQTDQPTLGSLNP